MCLAQLFLEKHAYCLSDPSMEMLVSAQRQRVKVLGIGKTRKQMRLLVTVLSGAAKCPLSAGHNYIFKLQSDCGH